MSQGNLAHFLFMRTITFYLFTLFIAFFSFSLGFILFVLNNHCVDFSVLEYNNPGKPSIVLDDQGNEWTRFQRDRREPVFLDEIPKHVVQAFIAAEDHNFFNHHGIS